MNSETEKAMMCGELIFGQGAPNAQNLGWHPCCQAWSFNRFTFREALAMSRALGLKVIEAYPGQRFSFELLDVILSHEMAADEIDKLQALLLEADIKLVNYGVVPLPADEAECRRVFDFAKRLGIETIVSEPPQGAIMMLDEMTREYEINVAIHNHPDPSPYWHPEIVLETVAGWNNPRLGACADTGHWLRSNVSPMAAVKMLEGRIVSFHFKDLNEWGMKGHDVPWGTGVCGAKELLTEICRQGFKGVFSVEYEHNWDNSLPEIAQCVANFDQIAAELA